MYNLKELPNCSLLALNKRRSKVTPAAMIKVLDGYNFMLVGLQKTNFAHKVKASKNEAALIQTFSVFLF